MAGLAFGSNAAAQGVTLSVNFYDAVSGAPVTSVGAGGKVKVVATIAIANGTVGAPVKVDASAKVKVGGINIPYKIPMFTVTGQNTNPHDGGALVQSGTQQGLIRVPTATPSGSSIKVVAQATVSGAVSNVVRARLSVQ